MNRFIWLQAIFLWELFHRRCYVLFVEAQKDDQIIPFFEGPPDFGFIGNSYKSYNRLPTMFKDVAENGIPEWANAVYTEAFHPGGLSLGDHLQRLERDSGIRNMLVERPREWKWVILQDQSQIPGFFDVSWSTPDNVYSRSEDAVQVLDEYIADTGGQTMLFMTWGRMNGDTQNPSLYPNFMAMQRMLAGGYLRFVELTSTPQRPTFVAPVGLVFQTIYTDLQSQGVEPTTEGTLFHSLYNRDESHPSPTGSYVAALTIYTTMFGLDPEAITWWPNQIDEDTAQKLQQAVSRTILATHESGYITYPWTVPWTKREATGPSPTPDPTPAPVVVQTPAPITNATSAPVMPPILAPLEPAPTVSIPTESPISSSPTPTETLLPNFNDIDDGNNEIIWEILLEESFENATASIFTDISTNNAQITDWYASEGAYSLELKHSDGFVSTMILEGILQDWIINPKLQQLRLTFDYFPIGQIDEGEGFLLRRHDGNGWDTIQKFEKGTDWVVDEEWYTTILVWPANHTTQQLQFLSSFREPDGLVFIDHIRLEAEIIDDTMAPSPVSTGVNDTMMGPSAAPTSTETELPSLAPSFEESQGRSSEPRDSGVIGAKFGGAALNIATLLGMLLWMLAH